MAPSKSKQSHETGKKKEVSAVWESDPFKYKSHLITHCVKKLSFSIPRQTLNVYLGKECNTIKSRRDDDFKKHHPSPFEKIENIVFDFVCSMNNFNDTLLRATLKKAGKEV